MRTIIRCACVVAAAMMLVACTGSRSEEPTAEAAAAQEPVDCFLEFTQCEDRAVAKYRAVLRRCRSLPPSTPECVNASAEYFDDIEYCDALYVACEGGNDPL